MSRSDHFSSPANQPGEVYRPVAVVTQLMQSIATMHHIDELFLWMANALIRHLGVEAAQIWVNQAYSSGGDRVELRVVTSSFPNLPAQLYSNDHIVAMVRHCFAERKGSAPVSMVGDMPGQINMFTQFGLNCWLSAYSANEAFIPPRMGNGDVLKVATPLSMVASLFTRQVPDNRHLRAIQFVLDQSLRLALNANLLVANKDEVLSLVSQQAPALTLPSLIPHKARQESLEQAQNPFANAVVISDKKARRLYFAVDGSRTVSDIAQVEQMNIEEVESILRLLLQKKYVYFTDVNGNRMDDGAFL